MTNEEAVFLLSLPKYIIEKNKKRKFIQFDQPTL